ncbi:MAG TPA: DUF2183 domain-containing protein [Spirochaetota bacterium]|nr:DUF2183 domain-containing protein [Spirochaetota bacterium]
MPGKRFFAFIIFLMMVCFLSYSIYAQDNYPQLDIKSNENLVFIPSYSFYDKESNTYHIRFHAWVYESEASSKKRKLLLMSISKSLDIDENKIAETNFEQRAQYLLYDNESSKWVSVYFGGEHYNLGVTDKTGHTERELVLPPEILKKGLSPDVNFDDFKYLPSWITFKAGTSHDRNRIFEGKAKYLPPEGVLVVSDIDDTIKVTEVNDRKKMLKNTFLNPYKSVDGMSGLYSSWETEGADFFYLSASPWQLYEPLKQFLAAESFPDGLMHMKTFDLPSGIKTIFDNPEIVKIPALKKLMKSFPGRKFILVGDSGEKDPEIYGKIAAEYGDRIAWILIRNVTDEMPDSKRFNDALRNFPRGKFRLFKNPAELYFINASNIK